MVQPTALNVLVIGMSMIVFAFLWRMAAGALIARSEESALGKAMGSIL